ncbi:glycosyltransferase family 4 protein [Nemorincola caseinilytica]|uniref:Glycosyltransferase family 4 protein n=1 Tax=Nemorincola caseinilytica TaxID=2054315 RepID=A0ABP8NCI2_9BACT
MKVALVQDWFNANGGAEKVVGEILETLHNDDVEVYALFDKFGPEARTSILKGRAVNVSLLQHVPFISSFYRYFLPVMPWLMGRFHLRGYDLIISTSHAVAKGFRADPSIPSICYCHTPLRPIWDMYDDYAANHSLGGSFVYRKFVAWLRRWDVATAGRVHHFIANSKHIQQRIAKSYGRDSVVIYPPVRTSKFTLSEATRKEYYMCPGRFVPYKKIDMVIRAFQKMPDKKLVLIGEGWGASGFDDMLRGHPNIEWLGYRDDNEVIKYMQEAKACIFAAKEDFGIMCVETQACGTPVLALDYGGYRETVVDGVTGYFFAEQTEESVIEAVNKMEERPLNDHKSISMNAQRFSDDRFRAEFSAFVGQVLQQQRS